MRKKKIVEDAIDEVDSNITTRQIASKPIQSLFDNVFCTYNSDYDDSYIKWLLEDEKNLLVPVLTLESKITRPKLKLKSVDELLTNASIPDDYVTGTTVIENTDEEEAITIL